MDGLHIDVSVDVSFSSEGEFGNMSFNGIDNIHHAQQPTTTSTLLSFPIERIKPLGQGSSSIVYKSVMLNKLRVTAEKVFIIGDTKKKVQLFRELESLKSICLKPSYSCAEDNSQSASPFIVQLLEVFSNPADGTLSLCLEYMDCGSLENVVQSGGCANEVVLSSIAFQMVSGLAFLHEKRLIHRDVKPSNALISSDGCVKLADFGLARTLDSGQSVANSFVGTFLYMAPERLTGEGYSFQSDIWGAGLTIHAVAVGHFPYVGKTGYWEVLHATQQGPPAVVASHSAALRAFLSLAYEIDVQRRASAATLLAQAFVRPTTPGALDTIPPPLRHLVCHRMASEEKTSSIVSSIKIPIIGTPAGSMPQSAPCTTTGNLTFRTPQESRSTKKPLAGRGQEQGQVRRYPGSISGTTRTALVQQQAVAGRRSMVDSQRAAVRGASTRPGGQAQAPVTARVKTEAAAPCRQGVMNNGKIVSNSRPAAKAGSSSSKLARSTSTAASPAPIVPRVVGDSISTVRGLKGAKRSVSATVIKSARSQVSIAESNAEQATPTEASTENTPVPVPAQRSEDTKESPLLAAEVVHKLVLAWQMYVTLARQRRSGEDARRGALSRGSLLSPSRSETSVPAQAGTSRTAPKESYDYAASPSVAVSNLRRLVSRQHDSREVFVTELMVQDLARTLPCDTDILRAEFCAALTRINAAWKGSAVQRIPSAHAHSTARRSSPPATTQSTGVRGSPTGLVTDVSGIEFRPTAGALTAASVVRTLMEEDLPSPECKHGDAEEGKSFPGKPSSSGNEGDGAHDDEDVIEDLSEQVQDALGATGGSNVLDESIEEDFELLLRIKQQDVLLPSHPVQVPMPTYPSSQGEGSGGEEVGEYADESFEEFND